MNIKKFVFSGILAMALVFGFVLSGCAANPAPAVEAPAIGHGDDGAPKTIIITGFNPPSIKDNAIIP